MKISRIITIILVALFIIAVARLARLENGGPPHTFIMLPGNEPATMYMPGPGDPFSTQFPKPVAQRAPAIVLIHGFMSDRVMMSTLARRLAENGYGVLAIDVRGHGENRNPFNGSEADSSELRDEVKQAVEYLHRSNLVDGSRIAVIGHSMGAGAALDYATNDPNLKGAVMISGGWTLGPERPKNALFIFAERDPDEVVQGPSITLASNLASIPQIELGKVYGDFAQGTAVEAIRVPGVDHLTIISSSAAAAEIVKWLDSTFGTSRAGAPDLADPRHTTARFALVVFLILLVPLGRVCGSIAPKWADDRPGPGGWISLLMLGGALIASMPLAAANPASFVPVVIGDIEISWFAVAGLIILGALAVWQTPYWERLREGAGGGLLAGAAGFAAVYVCRVAMSVTFHHLSLSPERIMVMAIATVLLFPFWIGFEWLMRRGELLISTVWASVGRVLILVLIAVGVSLRVLSFALILILPILGLGMVMIEIFAASAYSASRNLMLIAIFETLWVAWSIAAAYPITFMF